MYFGYGTNKGGILQIVDREKGDTLSAHDLVEDTALLVTITRSGQILRYPAAGRKAYALPVMSGKTKIAGIKIMTPG